MKSLFNSHHIKLILHNKYLAFDSKQLEFEISEGKIIFIYLINLYDIYSLLYSMMQL